MAALATAFVRISPDMLGFRVEAQAGIASARLGEAGAAQGARGEVDHREIDRAPIGQRCA